jgi:hypothetical protein
MALLFSGRTNDSQSLGRGSIPRRATNLMTKNKHNQICCKKPLATFKSYIGNGIHYWLLKCDKCDKHYSYNTYSLELRLMSDD